VHNDSKLNFNVHVDNTAKKANGVYALVQWSTHFCPLKTKADAYKSLVRPVVEYTSTVWSPHTKENITKLETVQRKSARWVMSDWHCTSSVTAMLESLEWPSLEARRAQARVIMLHKIINNLVYIDTNQYIEPAVVRGEEVVRFIITYART